MQSKSALDMVKRNIGFVGINALMRLVNNKNVPNNIGNFAQLVVFTTEIHRPFYILQADKLNAFGVIKSIYLVYILLPCYAKWLAFEGFRIADKAIAALCADKMLVIRIPRICDSGAVCDNK